MYKADDWIPDQIIVKRAGKETSTFQAKGQSIKCPLQCALTIMNPKNEEKEVEVASSEAEDISGDDQGDVKEDEDVNDGSRSKSDKSDESSKTGFENTYHGQGLSDKESKDMLELTCDDKIKDNEDFGPKYGNKLINFESFIAVCPKDCWKPGSSPIFGVGVHPEESSICRSAIVDHSMPFFGGVIGVGVMHGLPSYEAGPTFGGLEVKAHQSSPKSFMTYKVDNADFMSSDVRIIDHKGSPNFMGRLEFRMNGVWGTACSKKMTSSAAKKICRQLKYQDGNLKSLVTDSSSSTSFCRSYKGEDFCGPNPQPIHYMSMNCDGVDGGDIMKCFRELANKNICTHDDDAIIECTNINYEYPVDPLPGTVRLVNELGSPASDGSGRLEFYMGSWGSICNSKFSDKAANVACRQMGYLSGKLMGTTGQMSFCLKFKGKNHCGNQKINLNDVDCKGSEAKLKECGGSSTTQICNHEQDTIISCEGNKGDPSGKSQLPEVQINSPNFGKLPLLPIITAKCDTKFSESIFRGDSGSIFLVNCPAGCVRAGGLIWGTSIYASESSICRAGIHTGVIQDIGGLVEVVKKPGLNNYQATSNRGITSTPFGNWPFSFVVTKPNALAIKLSQSIKGKEKDSNQHSMSFMQMGEKSILAKTSSKPVFAWFPPIANFEFDGKETRVKTQGVSGVEKTSQLTNTLAIATKINMKKNPNHLQTVISHSACGGFALMITATAELVFGKRCSEDFFNTGFYIPLNTEVSIVINYDGKNVEAYINGVLFHRAQFTFNFKLDKNLDIGAFSDSLDETFNGKIDYALFFELPIALTKISKLAQKGLNPNKKGQKLKNTFTLDNRLCISECTKNPIPGTPGSIQPPASAQPNQGEYPEGDVKEGMGEGEGIDPNAVKDTLIESDSKDAELKNEDLNAQSTDQIKCNLPGNDKRFQGPTGKTFRVNCPKNCAQHPEGNAFGSLIYSDDSAICKAALHAGFIKDNEGGQFILEIVNGLDKYESSFKNEISSAARGASPRSIIFKEAPTLTRINCDETAASSKFIGSTHSKFTVLCAPECSKISNKVYGLGPFTDDSSICQAAILAGVLTDKGGEVSLIIADGQSSYKGGMANGIKSVSRDNYIRSFKLLGSSRTTCRFFKEGYEDLNLMNHWKVLNAKGLSTRKPGAWSFSSNPLGSGLAVKQSNDVMGSEYNYGTSLINKQFECGEGVFNLNVYMEKAGQGAILFRFLDENNFYALEMNQPGEKNLRLVKKSQGTGTLIKSLRLNILPKEWYRFKIMFHLDNLQVWLQKGSLRNLQMIFNVSDNDVQRGSVGFATQGNSNVYFDGIGVQEYDPKYGVFNKQNKEQRVWDSCLTGADEGHRKKYCKNIYGSYLEGRKKCESLNNFCEICCDRTIQKAENILNHACWKSCVKVIYLF